MCCLNDFADNLAGDCRVLFEPFRQLFTNKIFDRRTNLGRDQFVFGLGREFRVRHFHRKHTGQTFAGIVACEADLFFLRDARGLRVVVDRTGQRATEARHMGAAVALRDVVGEG